MTGEANHCENPTRQSLGSCPPPAPLQVSCLAVSVPQLSPAIRTISQAKLSVFLEAHKAGLNLLLCPEEAGLTKQGMKE